MSQNIQMQAVTIINFFFLLISIRGERELCKTDIPNFTVCQKPSEIIAINRTHDSESLILMLEHDVTIGPGIFTNLNISKLEITIETNLKFKKKFYGFDAVLDHESFNNLPNLRRLTFDRVNIKLNGDVFSPIQSLKMFKCSSCSLEEVPSSTILKFLPELEKLSLDKNNINVIHANAFADMKKLRSLDLSKNKISTLEDNWTNGLAGLKTLDLTRNSFTTIPALTGLSELEMLDLSFNFEITLITENAFKAVPKLTELRMRDTSLKYLYSGVFDDVPLLKILKLSGNKLSEIEKNIFNKLNLLENLQLSSNHIARIQTNAFSRLNLSDLNLERNNMAAVDTGAFNDLNVRHLKLKYCHISEIRPSAFNGLTAFQVDLGQNKLKFIGSGDFSGLVTDELDLNDNEISEIAPGAFNDTTVERVSLIRNHLEEEDKLNWGLPETVKMETLNELRTCKKRAGRCWI